MFVFDRRVHATRAARKAKRRGEAERRESRMEWHAAAARTPKEREESVQRRAAGGAEWRGAKEK